MHLLLKSWFTLMKDQADDSTFNYEQKCCEYAQAVYEFNQVRSPSIKRDCLSSLGQVVMQNVAVTAWIV